MPLKVFVSSTCYDLIDLRAEIKKNLKDKGVSPIMSDQPDSEFQTYNDQNSIETCLINLRESEVVILILSQRYGPSLLKAGFEDKSATHLEYLEAVKQNKKIILFVRDRLEADYTIYKKSKGKATLSWIDEKDTRIFEIIEQHKKLSTKGVNNWYWTFRNSLDIKERLDIDFKNEFSDIRLQQILSSGNTAMLALPEIEAISQKNGQTYINLTIKNFGTQLAIEPILLIYQADSFDEIIANEKLSIDNPLFTPSINGNSLQPGESTKMQIQTELSKVYTDSEQPYCNMILEIVYRTIQGDILSDISEFQINFSITRFIDITSLTRYSIYKKFIKKYLRNEEFYTK